MCITAVICPSVTSKTLLDPDGERGISHENRLLLYLHIVSEVLSEKNGQHKGA